MNPELSSRPVPLPWSERVGSRSNLLIDYERGGATIGVASNSSEFEWQVETDGTSVWVSREGVAPVLILTDTNITEVNLALDQTMNVHIAFVADGVAKWRYWDTLTNSYQVMTLTDCRTPRCCSDEKTPEFSGVRDVILTYLRDASLYVRLQHDRYTVEYAKVPDEDNHESITESSKIASFGMNTGRRLQWRFQ